MSDEISFGRWLQRRRKALGLTQAEVAQHAGCAAETLRKIEADARRPSRQIAERLADALELPSADRTAFVRAARAELSVDHLAPPTQGVDHVAFVPSVAFPTGTVTFLFTDIEGSTQLWEQHPVAMREVLARHDTILREALETQGGVVFKTTGDGLCAAFARAPDGLAAGLAAQRALQHESWGVTGPLRVRMALHTGAADMRSGDYIGPPLNRVARILATGHGGQVLLSAATWELVRDHLPPDTMLHDLGAHWLRSLPRPEQIYQLVAPDLPAEFPPLIALDRPQTNLPAQATTFIGREREVAALCDLLRRVDVRLVTLTGPGGAGKTRLSLQAIADLLDASSAPLPPQRESGAGGEGLPEGEGLFPDGVWFVNLAPLSDPGLVTSAIAQALDVREGGVQPPRERLKDYLRAKRLLLLLDNFEQVVDAAPLISELLAAAPGLKVLATSRMPLHLSGEREFAVPPLALPPLKTTEISETTEAGGAATPKTSVSSEFSVANLKQYEAVRLFIERAQAVKADFAVTNENAPAVAEICYQLDGLPLAIELAAARVKLFSPQALLARLDQRLKLLTGGPRDLPARQQTIRNTIDWSYHLLDAGEQTLFARLGVFRGGCTIEAVEAVCNAGGDLPMDVVDGVAALLDKSLLRRTGDPDAEPRITMLETIREYALVRLEQSGAAEVLRRRHTHFFVAFVEAAEPELTGLRQSEWLDQLGQEHDNVRAALAWALERGEVEAALRIGAALWGFWWISGHLGAGRRWLEAALARPGDAPPAVRAKALNGAGGLAWAQGDYDRAAALIEESLALRRAIGDRGGAAESLLYWGRMARNRGDYDRAAALEEQSLALFRELGNQEGIAWALLSLGDVALEQGDTARALPWLQEALAVYRGLGDAEGTAWALCNLGRVARAQGDGARAEALLVEGLALLRELRQLWGVAELLIDLGQAVRAQGDGARAEALLVEGLALLRDLGGRRMVSRCLEGLAEVAAAQGWPERAARLFGAAEALRETLGAPLPPVERAPYDDGVGAARARLDAAAFAVAWAAGRAMTLEQATAYALNESTEGNLQ